MRCFVAGGEGFIGSHIVAALRTAGHEVTAGARRPVDVETISCDFSQDLEPAIWARRLAGIDAVVNAVGILRESKGNTFERLHVEGPRALFEGCRLAGVRRVIQISAVGSEDVGEYIISKHRGDALLAEHDLSWTVIRPSVVYTVHGSYGGTSLLRAMAALPFVMFVPGAGEQLVQPILAEDLSRAIVHMIESGAAAHRVISAVGPDQVTLSAYLLITRRWLGLPPPAIVKIPKQLALCGAWIGEYLGNGPVGITTWRVLMEGSVALPNAAQDLRAFAGVSPKSLQQAFAESPSYVQDRWHAQLYFLAPILRIALAMLWIGSAVTGFLTPAATLRAFYATLGVQEGMGQAVVGVASTADLCLGALALIAWRPPVVASLMCFSTVIYTVLIGIAFPASLLEPFGGLLKNLPLIPATLMMGILSRRR